MSLNQLINPIGGQGLDIQVRTTSCTDDAGVSSMLGGASLTLPETTTPSGVPDTGHYRVYIKAGILVTQDDQGVETPVGGGGSPVYDQSLNTTDDVEFNKLVVTTDIVNNTLGQMYSTGVLSGGVVSIGSTTLLFDISAGSGLVVNPADGTYIRVEWAGIVDRPIADFSPNGPALYLYFDSTGTLFIQTASPSPTERRDRIYVGGMALDATFTTIIVASTAARIAINPANQLRDLTQALGAIGLTGNNVQSDTLLTLTKSVGTIYADGDNWAATVKDPSTVTIPEMDSTGAGTFVIGYRSSANDADLDIHTLQATSVIPGQYDDGSGAGAPVIVGNNQYTNMRYLVTSGGTSIIMPGQRTYTSFDNAVAGLSTENFVVPTTLAGNSLMLAAIVSKGNETNLSSANASIVPLSRFGGGGSGSSATTLDGAYSNSATPQITTTPGGGALVVKQGTGSDSDDVQAIANGAGTRTITMKGNGALDAIAYYVNGNVGSLILSGLGAGGGNLLVGGEYGSIGSAGQNASYGVNCLNAITNGCCNFVAGHNSGNGISGTSFNIVIGGSSLNAALTGLGNNIVMGSNSLTTATTADHNVIIGSSAMQLATTAADNVMVGHSTGGAITTANACVCVGDGANAHPTFINQIAIGAQATATEAHSCVIGNSSLAHIRGATDGQVDLGTSSVRYGNAFISPPTGTSQANAGASLGQVWAADGHATLPDGVLSIGVTAIVAALKTTLTSAPQILPTDEAKAPQILPTAEIVRQSLPTAEIVPQSLPTAEITTQSLPTAEITIQSLLAAAKKSYMLSSSTKLPAKVPQAPAHDLHGFRLTGLAKAVAPSDAVTLGYLDTVLQEAADQQRIQAETITENRLQQALSAVDTLSEMVISLSGAVDALEVRVNGYQVV